MSSGKYLFATKSQLSASEYFEDALLSNDNRMLKLGISKDVLLDPEEPIDKQVLTLRAIFLQAEKSSLPFAYEDENFWRILKAKIQPIVLAYLTHEKFVQSLDSGARNLRQDALMDVYRDRLENSEQFRKHFFELSERVMSDASAASGNALELPDSEHKHFDGMKDAERIQGNVIKTLQATINELEKKEAQSDKRITNQDKEIFTLQDQNEKLQEKMREMEKKIADLGEKNLQLQIANDAAIKSGLHADGEAVVDASGGVSEQVIEPATEAKPQIVGDEELLQRIEELEGELESTQAAAYGAFMANSDLGIVILFMMTAFRCRMVDQLGKEVPRSVGLYGIHVVFRMTVEGKEHFYTNNGNVSQVHKSLMSSKQDSGNVYEEDKTLIIYESACALMITNMPIEDSDKSARLKDNLSTLMKAADAALSIILLNSAGEKQKIRMEQLILRSNEVFQKLRLNLRNNQTKAERSVYELRADIAKVLGIAPGDNKSVRLNSAFKPIDEKLRPLFKIEKLVDGGFLSNIEKVAASFSKPS